MTTPIMYTNFLKCFGDRNHLLEFGIKTIFKDSIPKHALLIIERVTTIQ